MDAYVKETAFALGMRSSAERWKVVDTFDLTRRVSLFQQLASTKAARWVSDPDECMNRRGNAQMVSGLTGQYGGPKWDEAAHVMTGVCGVHNLFCWDNRFHSKRSPAESITKPFSFDTQADMQDSEQSPLQSKPLSRRGSLN